MTMHAVIMRNFFAFFFTLMIATLLQVLGLQTASAQTTEVQNTEVQSWQYTVKKDDYLRLICQQYCVKNADLKKIAQFNQIHNPNLLQPNQVVSIPLAYLKLTVLPAHVLNVNGDVRIKKSGAVTFQPLKLADAVNVGESIETGVNGVARLTLADGTLSSLQPNTRFTLLTSQQYAGKLNYVIKVNLAVGRSEFIANPQHLQEDYIEVETPTAAALVRGTVFRVGSQEAETIEETLQGAVAFSAVNQTVTVAEQFGTLARDGEPPMAPQKLPEAPNIQSFANVFYGNQANFNLTLPSGFAWVAQLAKDSAFNEVMREQVGAGALQLQDLPLGQYYLKLRAQDAQGLQSVDAVHVFTVKPALPALVLIAPLNQTLSGDHQLFTWKALPENQGYLLQIASDENFESTVLTRELAYNTFELLTALPPGQYYWRVAAKYAGRVPELATSHFSELGQFSF